MIFGNGIAAIPSAHTCYPSGCSKCECAQGKPNDVEKKILAIVAMPLRKMGGKKKIVVAEITCEELKKKKYYVYNIFTTFSQFHYSHKQFLESFG